MQIALDDLHFREGGGKQVAEIEIATAEKIARGDFSFRVERATVGRPNGDPGGLAPYVRQWTLRPDTKTPSNRPRSVHRPLWDARHPYEPHDPVIAVQKPFTR